MASPRGKQSAVRLSLAAALLAQLGPALAQAADEAVTVTEPAPAEAASSEPSLTLKMQREFAAQRPGSEDTPVFAVADRIEGAVDRTTEMHGNVELRQGTDVLKADDVFYRQDLNQVLAKGNVRIYRAGDRFTGPELQLRLDTGEGYFLEPHYFLYSNNAQGHAQRIDFLSKDRLRMTEALYSTCPPEQRDWFLRAASVDTDQQSQEGVARSATLYFKDVPILWAPVFSFPLSDERKSGFLSPVLGATNKGGAEVTTPYYWNIAPNRDMTLYPKMISLRGLQLGAEIRYLEPQHNGIARLEYMPQDRAARRARGTFSVQQETRWADNAAVLRWDLNYASDNDYFRDFSRTISESAKLFLPRDVQFSYSSDGWDAAVRATKYQTLQDPAAPVTVPYERLPQINLNARKQDVAGFDLAVATELTQFAHPTLLEGTRFVASPSIALPWQTPGFFIKPKLTLRHVQYDLKRAGGGPSHLSRSVPIFSLDSGMVFERDIGWFGKAAQQTLEPRAFYLRVPYRNQDALPNFDTGLSDFNFAQMFSENIFSGSDRVADANQVTAALISRVLDAESGSQILRVAAGQRFSFIDPQVFLPEQSRATTRRSDFLLSATGQLTSSILLDYGLQYNPASKEVQKTSTSVRYQPEPRKVINGTYRYTADLLEQFDVSGQWPLARNWYGVGRVNYSLSERRMIESIAGLEYNSCCWILRLAVQRFAVATNNTTTAFFIQLEFKGMGSLGSDPRDVLRRNVSGYTPLESSVPARPRPLTEEE